jgi:hypothetical protein
MRSPPVPQLDGFQAGEQSELLLVQQTVEQHYGSLQFIGETWRGEASATRGTVRAVCRVRI